MSNYGAAENLW